jgi:hypothetical protein
MSRSEETIKDPARLTACPKPGGKAKPVLYQTAWMVIVTNCYSVVGDCFDNQTFATNLIAPANGVP